VNGTAHDVDNSNLTYVMAGMREVGLIIKGRREYNFLKKEPKKAKVEEQPIVT